MSRRTKPSGWWAKWEGMLERRISCKDIWYVEPQRIKFMVQAMYDVLPSLANLHVWGKTHSPACLRWPGKGSWNIFWAAAHQLGGRATTTGGMTRCWRRWQRPSWMLCPRTIKFVAQNTPPSSGKLPQAQPRPAVGLLTSATDGELRVGLGRQVNFSMHYFVCLFVFLQCKARCVTLPCMKSGNKVWLIDWKGLIGIKVFFNS